MSTLCAHCGEMYPEERPNCPHCGADADLTYSDDSEAFDDPRMQAEDYDSFLEREGLVEARKGKGCSLPLLALLPLPFLF